MGMPLTKDQQKLRGRDVKVMTDEQLADWIEACDAMENWVKFNKARRAWKQSRKDAEDEIERRRLKAERRAAAANQKPKP